MKRLLFAFGLGSLLALSGCGMRDFAEHRSESGEILESYLPSNVDQIFSYSLRDDGQWAEFQNWPQDLDVLSESGVDARWSSAFPERYRVVWTLTQDGETPTLQGVATLKSADPVMPPQGFEPRSFLGRTVYRSMDDGLSVIQQGDLLLFASDDSTLLAMADRYFDESLWDSRLYRRALSQVGPNHLFYWISVRSLQDSKWFPAEEGVDYRSVAVTAEAEGLRLRFYKQGQGFAGMRSAQPYLFSEVDSKGLMAYVETHDLADQLPSRPDLFEAVDLFMTQYFSTGFDDELAPFLKRGAAAALYTKDGALFPEFTVLMDVSDDVDAAQTWVDRLDVQLNSVVERFAQAVPGAMTRATVQWQGGILNQVRLDLAQLNAANSAPLVPSGIPLQPLTLTFGVVEDRLIISTHLLSDDMVSVEDSALYGTLQPWHEQGDFVLVDPSQWASALAQINQLRNALKLGLSDSPWNQPDLLNEFEGALFTRDGGFLKFKHE